MIYRICFTRFDFSFRVFVPILLLINFGALHETSGGGCLMSVEVGWGVGSMIIGDALIPFLSSQFEIPVFENPVFEINI
jgi:hypothetical protein